ncbi:EF-hand domain-containing protein [Dolichospermum sp. UHCC 0259]|uniref:EF-hand domain-containing protein n=1 Tax=Dolichospermum sp. UHCC 0259 TaxID=2590010 RepID=UPI001446C56C|nr:EF-hand domain-containing protein [Dolichospermum sp. UHCC 0259]MTJ46948.1 hypothetical protein [Dolichospermum sp. UHCC 0259]
MLQTILIVFAANLQQITIQNFIYHLIGSEKYDVQVLLTSELSGSQLTRKLDIANSAFIFIQPADFDQVMEISRNFVVLANELGCQRIGWIAPACSEKSDLGKRLAEAENLVRSSCLETLILRHAPLFSDILEHKKELKYRRTLSMSLGTNPLPWVAPEVISQALYKWVLGEINNQPPDIIVGTSLLTGDNIAKTLSLVIKENLNGMIFARQYFDKIDVDLNNEISLAELLPYLLKLGYSQDEAVNILEETHTDGNGVIDFEEFTQGLGENLTKILADVPTKVQYINIAKSTSIYDMIARGIEENIAQSRLELCEAVNEYGLYQQEDHKKTEIVTEESLVNKLSRVITHHKKKQELDQWLGNINISLTDWAKQYVLDWINVYILPGRGILTINEGLFAEQPALITRLFQGNNRVILGKRTLDMQTVEMQLANTDTEVEVVSYQSPEVGERILKLKNGQIFSVSVRGIWRGLRLVTQLFLQNQPIPRWQVALFRELGELAIEEANNLSSVEDIVCNCTQTKCGKFQDLIAGGCNNLEQLVEQTQATTICGSCKPLIEEMLGSASGLSSKKL